MTELAVAGINSGSTVKAHVRKDANETVWCVLHSAFETYSNVEAAAGNYDVALTEQASSGYYVGNFPVLITTAGTYNISYYTKVSTVYTFEAAGSLEWTGTAVADDASGINWVTRAEYKTFKGYADTTYDAIIDGLMPMASALGNTYLGRTVKLATHSKVYRGKPNARGLNLGEFPIIDVATVSFEYFDDAVDEISGVEFYANEVGTIRFRPSSGERRAFNGEYIHVAFDAGYSTVPSDLKLACCLIMSALQFMGDDEQTIVSKDVGDVKIKYDNLLVADATDPVLSNARAILDRYADDFLMV